MQINLTQPLAGPAVDDLKIGFHVGMLGLDFSNRRRNRMHGRTTHIKANKLLINVSQSFGNCPKYINTRTIDDAQPIPALGETAARTHFDNEDRARIARADTLFIASQHRDGSGAAYEWTDISHRGGEPSFAHIGGDNTLTIPDYKRAKLILLMASNQSDGKIASEIGANRGTVINWRKDG